MLKRHFPAGSGSYGMRRDAERRDGDPRTVLRGRREVPHTVRDVQGDPRMIGPAFDLTRVTLAALFIAGLIFATVWILQPFLPALVWATTIVVATWPLMRDLQRWLWNRRSLAVAAMTVILLLVLIVPLGLAIGTIVEHADKIASWATSLATMRLPPPPA